MDFKKRVVGWWTSADEYALARVFRFAIVLVGVRCISALVGIDALTTVDYRGAPLTIWVSMCTTAAVLLWSVRAYFGPSENVKTRRRIHRWATERGISELPIGIVVCATLSLVNWWASSQLLGICAQYAPGTTSYVLVVVKGESTVVTPKSPCRRKFTLRALTATSPMDFEICAVTTFRNSVMSTDLSVGDMGVVELRETPFGRAVVRLDATK